MTTSRGLRFGVATNRCSERWFSWSSTLWGITQEIHASNKIVGPCTFDDRLPEALCLPAQLAGRRCVLYCERFRRLPQGNMRTTAPQTESTAPTLGRWRRWLFWLLVTGSTASLVRSPLPATADRLRPVAPWLGLGLLVTELMFVTGLALMALVAGVELGLNPVRWRTRMPLVLAGLRRTPWFWLGLVINSAGALGSALVVAWAVLAGLPRSAWGLLIVPLFDLALTVSMRTIVISHLRRNVDLRERSGVAPTEGRT